jgi:hypothetical protein
MLSIEKELRAYHNILRAKQRLIHVEKRLVTEKSILQDLKFEVDREYQDIVDLEKSLMHDLFMHVLSSRQQQMEKERQEYLLAILKYKDCRKLIQLLTFEKEQLELKLTDEDRILEQIQNNLNAQEDNDLYKESKYLPELKSLNADLKQLIKLKIEAEEALVVSDNLLNHFNKMIHHINEARDANYWGKYYNEIQEIKRKQQNDMDGAQAHAFHVRKLLGFLNEELKDVVEVNEFFKRSQTFIRGFNIEYYRNLIEDWIDDENLIKSMTTTLTGQSSIINLNSSLRSICTKSELEYQHQEKHRNRLIEKLTNDL